MRTVIALALLVLLAAPAWAYCPALPDDATSGYVANNTATALCLQRELARSTDAAAAQARLEADLRNLQIELERQRASLQPLLPDALLP